MFKHLRCRAALISILCCFYLSGWSFATDVKRVEIPAGDLIGALQSLAKQTSIELVYQTEIIKGLKTKGVSGQLSPVDALTKLLEGTGLQVSTDATGAMLIALPKSSRSTSDAVDRVNQEKFKKDSPQDSRVAQVDQGTAGPPAVENGDDQKIDKKKKEGLSEIVVTGTRIPVAATEGAQEVRVYTRQQIDQSGQSTVADFLNTLPVVSVATGESGYQTLGGATTVQLHGLPVGTTLVLLNGRRLETSGSQAFASFFDLNNIPLAAVERIEVLSQGASAIYGSDAIAGVVNIILKDRFNGFEANATYGAAADQNEWNGSATWGKQWDRGGVTLVGSFQNRGALDFSERTLTRSNDYRAYGGTDGNGNYCNPGNVYSVDGVTPLPGLGTATYAAVPSGFTGKPSISEFAATAGKLNECPGNFGASLSPATHRRGLFAQANYNLTPTVEVFTELLYSYVEQVQAGGFGYLYGSPGYQQYTVSASNPYNPFGTTVGVSSLFTDLPRGTILRTDFFRPMVGARGSLFDSWNWEISAFQSRDYTRNSQPNTNPNSTIQSALDSSNPATALNPFVAGPYGSPQLVGTLFSEGLYTYTGLSRAIEGFARGPLLTLPAGTLQLVIGGTYDKESLSWDYINQGAGVPPSQGEFSRHTDAVFGEARIPLLGHKEPSPRAGDVLAVTVAARRDHFSDFGSKTTPQYGLEWRPTRTLLIRATYADAFAAPTLEELYQASVSLPYSGIDPLTGKLVSFEASSGGNSYLKPETGLSRTLGLVWSPKVLSGLDLSITYWEVNETSYIGGLAVQALLNNENLFPGLVIRNSSGQIVLVNDTFVNFGRLDLAGFDYALSYKQLTGVGTWLPSIGATQTYRYLSALAPQAPAINSVSVAQDSGQWAPRWKGTVSLGWQRGPWSANIDGRYVSSYQDYDSTSRIGNFWLSDAYFRWALGEGYAPRGSLLHGAYVAAGAVNLFNRAPQFSNVYSDTLGYDPTQADIRGRYLYAQIGLKW